MLCPILAALPQFAKAPAIITDTHTLTYEELNAYVEALCIKLQSHGVKSGARVAFIATSSWQNAALFFALFRLNAAACPLNFRLPEAFLQPLIDQLAPHFIMHADFGIENYQLNAPLNTDEIAVLMPTSGSSGAAKIAALSYSNLYYSAEGSMQKLPLKPLDRWLLPLPLFHVSGLMLLFRSFLRGLTVIISEMKPHEALTKYEATFLSLVPTQLFRLCNAQPTAPAYLKGVLIGGAPLSAALLEEATQKGYKIFSSYGMTEMCAQITLDPAPKIERGELTCGTPLPHRELRVNSNGEILVRGKTLFLGYWDKTSGLIKPTDSEGWFSTKDRGKISDDGRLIVLGRMDSLFISGGENVFPEEIESALLALPDILEALVIPLPDPEFGHLPYAFINTNKDNFSEKQILATLRKSLPGYMIPRRIQLSTWIDRDRH